jgi:VanZ family protein
MFLRYNYPALLWALLIFILCAIPGPHVPRLKFLDWLKPDKIVHFILFGTLCFLLIRGFAQQSTFAFLLSHPKIYAVVLSSIYGIVIEVLQQYVLIKRTGEVNDAIADALGSFIGLWLYNFWIKRKLIHTNK